MNKTQRQEIKFLKYIVLKLDKEVWTEEDIQDIYIKFKLFLSNLDLDEISILRKGEVFLGPYIDTVDITNLEQLKQLIFNILTAATEDLNVQVAITIIGALTKLSLEKLNNKKEE